MHREELLRKTCILERAPYLEPVTRGPGLERRNSSHNTQENRHKVWNTHTSVHLCHEPSCSSTADRQTKKIVILQYGERQQYQVRHSTEDTCRDDATSMDCSSSAYANA